MKCLESGCLEISMIMSGTTANNNGIFVYMLDIFTPNPDPPRVHFRMAAFSKSPYLWHHITHDNKATPLTVKTFVSGSSFLTNKFRYNYASLGEENCINRA